MMKCFVVVPLFLLLTVDFAFSAEKPTKPIFANEPFGITLRFINPVSSSLESLFNVAVSRWESILVRGYSTLGVVKAGTEGCFTPQTLETADLVFNDLLIYVNIYYIDGIGGVVGYGGPCRLKDHMPRVSEIAIDSADLALMSYALINAVVLHEIAHALGFGTLWDAHKLLKNTKTGAGYEGKFGKKGFAILGGDGPVPVEDQYGSGANFAHWLKELFQDELMTAFLDLYSNPLSELTIESLRDLGYTYADAGQADPYQLYATENAELNAIPKLSNLTMHGDTRQGPVGPCETLSKPGSSSENLRGSTLL